jgi:hypothetical protein
VVADVHAGDVAGDCGFIPSWSKESNRLAICLFSVIAFYHGVAWDIWWYAGMGGRAMVQYYAALMFPLASLFELAGAGSGCYGACTGCCDPELYQHLVYQAGSPGILV